MFTQGKDLSNNDFDRINSVLYLLKLVNLNVVPLACLYLSFSFIMKNGYLKCVVYHHSYYFPPLPFHNLSQQIFFIC